MGVLGDGVLILRGRLEFVHGSGVNCFCFAESDWRERWPLVSFVFQLTTVLRSQIRECAGL